MNTKSNMKLLEDCKKSLSLAGVKIISTRDAGILLQFLFEFVANCESQQILEVFSMMRPRDLLNIEDPENGDCIREVRRTEIGYELKHGCHGAYGTWRESTATEAVEWILAAAMLLKSSTREVVIMFQRYV